MPGCSWAMTRNRCVSCPIWAYFTASAVELEEELLVEVEGSLSLLDFLAFLPRFASFRALAAMAFSRRLTSFICFKASMR